MKKIKIVVLSLFDGISCGRVALDSLPHVEVLRYYSAEINKTSIQVADYWYPQDTEYRLGDVREIDCQALIATIKKDFGDVKILLLGGSPCQDFSPANAVRAGVAGEKSSLFYEFVRIKSRLNPDYFLLENVRMTTKDEYLVNKAMRCKPIVINSKVVSPQLRHRLYWTNINGVKKLQDKGITLNSCLHGGYSDREKSRALLASDARPLTTPIKMAHRYFNTGFTTLIFLSSEHYKQVKSHFDTHFKGKSAKEIDSRVAGMDLSLYDGVRYMTRTEREACQTMPIGYTSVLSENEAAGVLGDGWTVDVISHILSNVGNDTKTV